MKATPGRTQFKGGNFMSYRRRLTVAACALAAVAGAPAQATDEQGIMQELESLKARMGEFDALKARIQQLEAQVKANADAAAAAKAAADKSAAATADSALVMDKLSKGQVQIGHTNVSFGGWVQGSFGFREHNELAGPSSTSLNTPFPVQAQYHANEFRAGPPQTRWSLNTVSDATNDLLLKSKIEFDTLSGSNAAGTANGGSWTPRLRHAYMEIDRPALGWHTVIGQAYSLTIPNGNQIGGDGSPSPNRAYTMLPGTEATSAPDDGALAGLGATRNIQLRVVRDIAPRAAVAVSLENNQVAWAQGHGTTLGTNGAAASLARPVVSNSTYNGTTIFNSLGTAPDVVAKVSYDPTVDYHFEAWGLVREFKDSAGLATTLPGTGSTVSGGVGLASFTRLLPKLDLQLGVGYGAIGSQIDGLIPDATFDNTGKPVPIMDKYLYSYFTGHVDRNLDLIFQAGIEQGKQAGVSGSTTATAYGYGNPYGSGGALGNGACMSTIVLSGTGTCVQDNHRLWNVTGTAVWRVLNGPYGHVDFLPQIQYVQRQLFADQFGSAPHASNWSVDLAVRYFPF